MGFLLDIAYLVGLTALSPVIAWRVFKHKRYRGQFHQRFGKAPLRHGLQPVIWIHGVSLGEVNAARSIVNEIHRQLPDYRVIISTSTDTGLAQAKKIYAPAHEVFCWPLDFSLVVGRALDRAKPDLVVLMEGEAWPNFLAACNKRDIPAIVVNGRMSPNKGYPRYKKLGRIATNLFNRLTAIGVQDEIYAEKFRALNVKPEKVVTTGMLKFDTIEVASEIPGAAELAHTFDIRSGDQLLVAGGTGPEEEAIILDAYAKIREDFPQHRLVIVPRKPERFEEVAKLISSKFPCIRRSQTPDTDSPKNVDRDAVILGDTMGELRKFYSLASSIFVGRSLVRMGGSDMIEAAALGKPTCFGPHTFNFPQAPMLLEHGCKLVNDADSLAAQISSWVKNPKAAATDSHQAQEFIKTQKGASRRNVELICKLLGKTPARSAGDIATDAPQ